MQNELNEKILKRLIKSLEEKMFNKLIKFFE